MTLRPEPMAILRLVWHRIYMYAGRVGFVGQGQWDCISRESPPPLPSRAKAPTGRPYPGIFYRENAMQLGTHWYKNTSFGKRYTNVPYHSKVPYSRSKVPARRPYNTKHCDHTAILSDAAVQSHVNN